MGCCHVRGHRCSRRHRSSGGADRQGSLADSDSDHPALSQEHPHRDSGAGLSQRFPYPQDLHPHRAVRLPNRGRRGQDPNAEPVANRQYQPVRDGNSLGLEKL